MSDEFYYVFIHYPTHGKELAFLDSDDANRCFHYYSRTNLTAFRSVETEKADRRQKV
jgi:hypothetical protein